MENKIKSIIPCILHLNGNIFSFKHQSFLNEDFKNIVNDINTFHKKNTYDNIKLYSDCEIILSHNFKNIINNKICQKCLKNKKKKIIHIYPEKGMAEKCLDLMNVPYTNVSENVTKDWSNRYTLINCLKYLKQSKKKYILKVDSSDVIFLRHPNIIFDKFKKMKCKILFNAESELTMISLRKDKEFIYNNIKDFFKNKFLENSYNNNCYLNAGIWIGERDYLIDTLTDIVKIYNNYDFNIFNKDMHFSEQTVVLYYLYYLNNKYPNITIDNKCLIFQCLYKTNIKQINTS